MNQLIRKDHINLIRKIAWSFHNTTGLDWDDLFQEAALAYCKSIKSYNTLKGSKLTTWAWQCMRNQLINYIKNENENHTISLQDMEVDVEVNQRNYVDLELSMSEKAREMTRIALETPHILLALPKNMRLAVVAEKMMKHHNWTWVETRGVIKEVNDLLKTY